MKIETLFITNKDDISVEYLISKLRNHTSSYFRLNSEDIDQISFEINSNGSFNCKIEQETFRLDSVKSVIFRRIPNKFNNIEGDTDAFYLNTERKHFLEGLYLSLAKSKWINPMFSTQIAERKLFQLQLARKMGLRIPKSILTNNPKIADNFLKSNKFSIIKPISNGLQVLNNGSYSIYTTEIRSDFFSKASPSTLFQTPVYLQERIINKYDIRVTIIGETLFAVAISKQNKNEVDWRKPELKKEYKTIDLPNILKEKLIKLNKSLNLVYSAIDLIQTPNNEFVFLEVNPVGEWVWLENELGLNISETLIKEII